MITRDIKRWIRDEVFRQVPVNITVIDRQYRIVEANDNFRQTFGEWEDKHCFEVYKGRSAMCPDCESAKTFKDGRVRTSQEYGVDRDGRPIRYAVHLAPLVDHDGSIPYIVEMSTDITFVTELQNRYQLLFDKTPCYVTILDKDLHIVQANEKFKETFGEGTGRFCYELYKQSHKPCRKCPSVMAFQSGSEHTTTQTGIDKNGNETHYIVTASPLTRSEDGVETVIEIATDITRVHVLEQQLKRTFDLQNTVITSSLDALIVADENGRINIFNPAAEALLEVEGFEVVGKPGMLDTVMPVEFLEMVKRGDRSIQIQETSITTRGGEKVPVRLSASLLRSGEEVLGSAAFLQDLRPIKQLESEKLIAERLAAVGQTVAGLAHGVKNILMGLEGGMYVMNSGLTKNDGDRVSRGWEMLEANIKRISGFVKEFLAFAKGREPEVAMADPNQVARDVVDLYKDAAAQDGISLIAQFQQDIAPAPMDAEGIHTCLANLVSNAMDACLMSDKSGRSIIVRTSDLHGTIMYEVQDNGVGMDYEVKKKLFTTFFSTKGSHQGTGLGLLVTRKIIQEHGGKVSIDTAKGQGSTFRIELPRERLPEPTTLENDEP